MSNIFSENLYFDRDENLKKKIKEILWINKGFSVKTFFNSQEFDGQKEYMVFGGKLFVNLQGENPMTGEQIFETREADEKETQRFLVVYSKRMQKLNSVQKPDSNRCQCSLCRKYFNRIEGRRYYREHVQGMEFDENSPICPGCIPGYIKKIYDDGLDMDYMLVTGLDPKDRPDDWKMHDASQYEYKKECYNMLFAREQLKI